MIIAFNKGLTNALIYGFKVYRTLTSHGSSSRASTTCSPFMIKLHHRLRTAIHSLSLLVQLLSHPPNIVCHLISVIQCSLSESILSTTCRDRSRFGYYGLAGHGEVNDMLCIPCTMHRADHFTGHPNYLQNSGTINYILKRSEMLFLRPGNWDS